MANSAPGAGPGGQTTVQLASAGSPSAPLKTAGTPQEAAAETSEPAAAQGSRSHLPEGADEALEGQTMPQVALGRTAHTLTEALDRALDMLTNEREYNQTLRQTLEAQNKGLDQKQQTIDALTLQLQIASGKVAKLEDALDQWKKDVLGFRDEMRTAEEAEIEVLQEILMVLRSLKQDKELQPEQRS